jgi:hypothetical protein
MQKSNMASNYISEIKLLEPTDDIKAILNQVLNVSSSGDRDRVYNKCVDFSNRYTGVYFDKMAAWRADNNKGVNYINGTVDDRDSLSFFDSRDEAEPNSSDSYTDHVRPVIDSILDVNFDYTSGVFSVVSSWEAELSSEGISTDPKVIDENYNIWKKKYESENSAYVSALNSKNSKQLDVIEKKQLLAAYQPNLNIPVG